MAGIGPGPMCAMLLAELGATVLRVERPSVEDLGLKRPRKYDLLLRSRDCVRLDLKQPGATDVVLRLVQEADGLIEGFRPGVMERLGLGPEVCLKRNRRLVYGRITGWGQSGPLANAAAHDLNYIALTGVLNAIGRTGEPPTVPLSVIGDFGGGALFLALGMLAAMLEARSSGQGQVVDAAMIDGIAAIHTSFFGMFAAGIWAAERGTNPTDGGSHFTQVYECADGKWISIAPVEARFYAELLKRMDLDPAEVGPQMDKANWPRAKRIFAERFKQKTRDEWCRLFEGTDVCFAPVLRWDEVADHPHIRARGTIVEIDGIAQPAPAPRFSRTPLDAPRPPREPDAGSMDRALRAWLPSQEIEALRAAKIIP